MGMVDFDTVLDTMPFEIRAEEGDGGTVAGWIRGWGSVVLPDLKYQPVYSNGSVKSKVNGSEVLHA
jgi:hypothetical protein